MSFTRMLPWGYATNTKPTSAQFNKLDIDHANATDKTVAGDTWSGPITMAAGAAISVAGAGALIQASQPGAMLAGVPGGIQSQNGATSGFQFAGGATDFFTFSATRGRTICIPLLGEPLVPTFSGSLWQSANNGILQGAGNNSGGGIQVLRLAHGLHHGATLLFATLFFAVGQAHTGVPQFLPTIVNIYRTPIATPLSGVLPLSNAALGATPPTPLNATAWFNGGAVQSFSYVCNQNNAIDTTQYAYRLWLQDEYGLNALSGNQYFGLALTYSGISDMRFQCVRP